MYAVVHVDDMDRGETFYSTLSGRRPDDRPMDGLVQWRDVAGSNLQLVEDADRAGSSALTLVTPDMAAARRDLETGGIEVGPDNSADYGVVARISDPDGNRITLAEPPSRPFASS